MHFNSTPYVVIKLLAICLQFSITINKQKGFNKKLSAHQRHDMEHSFIRNLWIKYKKKSCKRLKLILSKKQSVASKAFFNYN